MPGAQSQAGSAAPAERIPMDMPPTEALFDAINRGDIAAARDALNRGADIDARNVLGMTPLDSSIDLGRNDISFLLLSMRGAGSAASQHRHRGRAAAQARQADPHRPRAAPRHGARGRHRRRVRRPADARSSSPTMAARPRRRWASWASAPAPAEPPAR